LLLRVAAEGFFRNQKLNYLVVSIALYYIQIMKIHFRKNGIVPVQILKELVTYGVVSSQKDYPVEKNQFQPNSIDLRLGKTAYRVRCGFLPENETVMGKIEKLCQHEFSLENGAVLEPNCTYIIPLLESLHLPESTFFTYGESSNGKSGNKFTIQSESKLTARTNPKSTTGRLDIFTRLVTDYTHRFEEISAGYKGPLYLEVVPKSFPVRVRTGQRLNQLRIRHGNGKLTDDEIIRTHSLSPVLFDENTNPVADEHLKVDGGLFMSVDLKGRKGSIVGYKARKNSNMIDLERIDHYKISEFWEPIYATEDNFIILEPEAFYIFASKERCRIPVHLAGEMVPYDTGSGELRTHYAGFFDSGFGGDVNDKGARAVLEVRSHDVPFLVEDGQTFFSMIFEANTDVPDFTYGKEIKSNYQGQGLKLSKHFKT
jgi:dCTP deaminase